MSVLSDKTIRDRIAHGDLIIGGESERAEHCSYEFTAAKILPGGTSSVMEVTEPGVTIDPAQLVWIRTREKISMPRNMVGLWIQTNSLSRQGLLMLNMSMVEPGYIGYLSAVFVNFGQKKVPIGPTTKIAKIIFLPLDTEADQQVDSTQFAQYDKWLLELAANAPTSFLQLESFIPDLEKNADIKLKAIDAELKFRSEVVQQQATESIKAIAGQVKSGIEKELRSDVKGLAWRWGGGILFGFVAGCLAVWFGVSTLLPQMITSYSKVDELVQKSIKMQQVDTLFKINDRVNTQAMEIETLRSELFKLRKERESFRKKY